MLNNKINIILSVLIVIILSLFVIERIKNNVLEKESTLLELELNKLDNKLEIFVDENGLYRARAESAESDLNNLKIVYDQDLKNLRKEISDINKNYKNLDGLYRVSLNTIGRLELTLDSIKTYTDTTYNDDGSVNNIKVTKKIDYVDKWITLDGKYIFNTTNSYDDSFIFDYSIRDSLTLVSYYKKENLFSKRNLYVQGISHNPKTKITNLSEIKISNHKEPKVSIGFQGGYGLTQYGFGWYIGVGVNKKISIW